MAFEIKNDPAATVNPALNTLQAQIDSRDLAIITAGDNNTGVISGCAVTANSLLTVAVAAGTVMVQGASVAVAAVASLAVSVADVTNPRFTLIWVDSSGAVTANDGAANAAPDYPTITADANGNLQRVVLAAIYVPALLSTILSTDITDKRMYINPKLYASRRFTSARYR
jgi:hypothetical protein